MSKTDEQNTEVQEGQSDGPLLDLTDASVKKFIKAAKARGYVTHDELNKVLPSDEVTPDQIEDVMSALSDMGINVVESEEEAEEPEEPETTAVAKTKATGVATTGKSDRYDRTDDPVRMYLREMGSVELLSREGEIAIAKRIEAGRDAMIRGLCESPLTFEAIMVWRQELADERVLLRDIIDLEATYAAENGGVPDNSANALAGLTEDEDEEDEEAESESEAESGSENSENSEGSEGEENGENKEDDDDYDDGGSMSMSAMEAELREGVTTTLDAIASDFQKYRKLQEKLVTRRLEGKALTPKDSEEYEGLQTRIMEELKTLHLNNARIESLVEQLYTINKRLMGFEGRSDAPGRCPWRAAQELPRQLFRQ